MCILRDGCGGRTKERGVQWKGGDIEVRGARDVCVLGCVCWVGGCLCIYVFVYIYILWSIDYASCSYIHAEIIQRKRMSES